MMALYRKRCRTGISAPNGQDLQEIQRHLLPNRYHLVNFAVIPWGELSRNLQQAVALLAELV